MSAASTRVIDTHLHVWDAAAPWMAWLQDRPASWQVVRRDFTWRQLRSELDRVGVADLILVQAGMTPMETRQLLRLAVEQPTVLGVVGWASLTSGSATDRDLASFGDAAADKLVGIRNNHGWQPDGEVLATAGALESCRVLAERGLSLDLHFRDYSELSLAVDVAERVPEGTYIIDHLGKPLLGVPDAFASWAEAMARLSALPNVYIKLSGWSTFVGRARASDVRPYVQLVLDAFGSDRIMYGGNWPVALVSADYRQTYKATLDALDGWSADEIEDVLYRTATACYLSNGRDRNRAPAGSPRRHPHQEEERGTVI